MSETAPDNFTPEPFNAEAAREAAVPRGEASLPRGEASLPRGEAAAQPGAIPNADTAPAPDPPPTSTPPAPPDADALERERGFWNAALAFARAGDEAAALEVCRAARSRAESFPGAWDLLEARARLEAGGDPAPAVDLAARAHADNRMNVVAPHALALARLRAGQPAEALALLKRFGLPHDFDLLGAVAIEFETAARAWPERLPEGWPTWPAPPASGPEPEPEPEPEPPSASAPESPAAQASAAAENAPDGAPTQIPDAVHEVHSVHPVHQVHSVHSAPAGEPQKPEPPAPPDEQTDPAPAAEAPTAPTIKLGWFARRGMSERVQMMETAFLKGDAAEVARIAAEVFAAGLDGPEPRTLAGIACEQAGDEAGARLHLARALELEPSAMIARAFLGRVYWRNGWNELACDLWRSIPVEGPDDYGRHYHLALAHHAAGRRADARDAMMTALTAFYPETREFFIDRAAKQMTRLATGG